MKKKISKNIVRRVTPQMRRRTDFAQVLSLIDAALARAVSAVNTTLIDLYWTIGQADQREDRGGGMGAGDGAGVGGVHSEAAAECAGIFGTESVAHDAVLRDLSGAGKTRTTVASFVLDPQFAHHGPEQARRGT